MWVAGSLPATLPCCDQRLPQAYRITAPARETDILSSAVLMQDQDRNPSRSGHELWLDAGTVSHGKLGNIETSLHGSLQDPPPED